MNQGAYIKYQLMNTKIFIKYRNAAFSLSVFAFFLPILIDMFHFRYMGMPDSYFSQLDLMQMHYFPVFCWLNIVSGIFFLITGILLKGQKLQRRIVNYIDIGIIAYLLFLMFSFFFNKHWELTLDSGQGG